jgi:hypothetical protein
MILPPHTHHLSLLTLRICSIVNISCPFSILFIYFGTSPLIFFPSPFPFSFFPNAVIPGGGSLTFSAVVLGGSSLGPQSAEVFADTSAGTVSVRVSVVVLPHPLRPPQALLFGVPQGGTQAVLVHLYNPYDEPLQVTHLSAASEHLSIAAVDPSEAAAATAGPAALSGSAAAAKLKARGHLAVVEPHTRVAVAVVTARPPARLESGLFRSFVTLNTTRGDLVVPVELAVLSSTLPQVHPLTASLQFGALTAVFDRKTLPLVLVNLGDEPVSVLEVFNVVPDPLVTVEIVERKVPAGSPHTVVANVVVRGGKNEGHQSGLLVVKLSSGLTLQVRFAATTLLGQLTYLPVNTTFAVPASPPFYPLVRNLVITNRFNHALVFHSASIADPSFEVADTGSAFPRTVAPGEKLPPLVITYRPSGSGLLYTTNLVLVTNATNLNVPLHVYHGQLTFSIVPEVLTLPQTPSGMAAVLAPSASISPSVLD